MKKSDPIQEIHDMIFAASPTEILNDAKLEGIAPAPPEEADYRPHDIDAIACFNCAHFEKLGTGEDSWPIGICHIWEAQAAGDAVCDKFALDEDHSDPMGEDPTMSLFSAAELICPSQDVHLSSDDGLIRKTIMRTGEWDKTPSSKGVLKKTLRVVRDGASDAEGGIVSLEELKANFDAGAYPYVTVPLTDEPGKDHKNLLRLNTGFIKELEIKDKDDGGAELVAGFHFTEDEAKGKVQRGTYPDVSAGLHFGVKRPDGQEFASALNHVCITPNPFMSDMGAFGEVMASDMPTAEDAFLFSHKTGAEETEDDNLGDKPVFDKQLSFSWRKEKAEEAFARLKEISSEFAGAYSLEDIGPDSIVLSNKIAGSSWVVPYTVDGESIVLADIEDWADYEEETDEEGSEQKKEEPAATPEVKEDVALSASTPLQQAQKTRALRAGFINSNKNEGGVSMSVNTKNPLEGIDLSDPEAVKQAVAGIVEENATLKQGSRTADVDAEVQKLRDEKGMTEELGFTGFLKTFREILLSDDGEPAQILLSHDDNGNEIGKEQVTATEIAQKLVKALPSDTEGKLLFSGQNLAGGNDQKPDAQEAPAGGGLDNSPEAVAERTREQSAAIGQPIAEKE